MAYTTRALVRERVACDEFKPDDSTIDNFISKAEIDLKNKLGNSLTKSVKTSYEKQYTFTIELPGAKSINEIYLNDVKLDEVSDIELLQNADVEKTEADEIQGWNESEGTGDTLSHDSDNAWIYTHSLKITKGAAVNSYFYSDTHSFTEQTYYQAKTKLFVDSNTAAHTNLKLEYLDTDDSIVKTYTSETLSVEITQPSAASVIAIVSDNANDIYQAIILTGRLITDGEIITEAIELNGTTSVNSDNSFVELISIEKSEDTEGTITLTSNAAGVTNGTLNATTNLLEKWQEVSVIGSPTEDSESMRVSFYVTDSTTSGNAYADTFQLRKVNWIFKQGKIYFANSVQGTLVIDYELAAVAQIIREMVRDLAALYTLLSLGGADSSGFNYDTLKSSSFSHAGLSTLYGNIFITFKNNMNKYISLNNTPFIMDRLS